MKKPKRDDKKRKAKITAAHTPVHHKTAEHHKAHEVKPHETVKPHEHVKTTKTVKHAGTSKTHHVTVHRKKTTTVKASSKPVSKVRRWSPDETVALCSARAVAEAIRLASGIVLDDADVLGLYWSTASDPDAGQALSEALTGGQDSGLIGFDPAWVRPIPATAPVLRRIIPPDVEAAIGVDGTVPVINGAEEYPVVTAAACEHALDRDACLAGVPACAFLGDCLPHQECLPSGPDLPWSDLNGRGPCAPALAPGRSITAGCFRHRQPGRTRCGLFGYASKPGTPILLLGLDLPWGEPHAVTVGTDGTWWSWGEPHTPADFPDAIIDEAWAVTLCAG